MSLVLRNAINIQKNDGHAVGGQMVDLLGGLGDGRGLVLSGDILEVLGEVMAKIYNFGPPGPARLARGRIGLSDARTL